MNGPRRLRLVGTAPRSAPSQPQLTPIVACPGSFAIGETVEGAGAVVFALSLVAALNERGLSPWTAVCDFDGVPALGAAQVAQLKAQALHSLTARIASQADLSRLVAESERASPGTPCVFIGEPALLVLSGTLKIVIDSEGAPEGLTPRARRLRAAAQLTLSSARAGVARLLAEGWHLPTPAP